MIISYYWKGVPNDSNEPPKRICLSKFIIFLKEKMVLLWSSKVPICLAEPNPGTLTYLLFSVNGSQNYSPCGFNVQLNSVCLYNSTSRFTLSPFFWYNPNLNADVGGYHIDQVPTDVGKARYKLFVVYLELNTIFIICLYPYLHLINLSDFEDGFSKER